MQLTGVQGEQQQDTAERLQFILQSAGIGTWDFYLKERKVYCDQLCKRLCGFSAADIISYRRMLDIVHTDDKLLISEAVQKAIDPQQRHPFHINFRVIGAADQQLRWLQCSGKAFFDEHGEAYRISGTVQDITEMRYKDLFLPGIENRFRLAFDNASLGLVLADNEGRFLSVNKAYSNITGYSQEELHSYNYSYITHPDDFEWNKSVIESLKKGDIPSFNINKRYIRKDGQVIWVNHQATIVTGKAMPERTIFSIVRDITADMQAREDLELSMEGGELGLWHVDLTKRIITLDTYCRELLELPEKDGFSYEDILSCIDDNEKDEVRRRIALAMRPNNTGNNFDIEFRTACTSEQRWVRMKGRAVISRNKAYRLAGTIQNISTQKQLQQYRDNFLGIASHELKTPVTTIKTYTQLLEMLLKGDTCTPETMHMVKRMNAQVDKLSSLINDLLDITRLQAGKLRFSESFFSFNAMVSEVVDELQHTTTTHTIIKRFDEVGDVYGDRERISQVVTNLLTNAIKYSPNAERIIVYTSLQDKDVMLCVEDFGIGIPEENRQKVFEQYYRVNGKQQHTTPGLGLGLFISSEIVKREGGSIWVHSEEGKGSTFCFTIPKDHREV